MRSPVSAAAVPPKATAPEAALPARLGGRRRLQERKTLGPGWRGRRLPARRPGCCQTKVLLRATPAHEVTRRLWCLRDGAGRAHSGAVLAARPPGSPSPGRLHHAPLRPPGSLLPPRHHDAPELASHCGAAACRGAGPRERAGLRPTAVPAQPGRVAKRVRLGVRQAALRSRCGPLSAGWQVSSCLPSPGLNVLTGKTAKRHRYQPCRTEVGHAAATGGSQGPPLPGCSSGRTLSAGRAQVRHGLTCAQGGGHVPRPRSAASSAVRGNPQASRAVGQPAARHPRQGQTDTPPAVRADADAARGVAVVSAVSAPPVWTPRLSAQPDSVPPASSALTRPCGGPRESGDPEAPPSEQWLLCGAGARLPARPPVSRAEQTRGAPPGAPRARAPPERGFAKPTADGAQARATSRQDEGGRGAGEGPAVVCRPRGRRTACHGEPEAQVPTPLVTKTLLLGGHLCSAGRCRPTKPSRPQPRERDGGGTRRLRPGAAATAQLSSPAGGGSAHLLGPGRAHTHRPGAGTHPSCRLSSAPAARQPGAVL